MPSGERLDDDAGDLVGSEASGELFYRGTLIRLMRGGDRGVVRSNASGREFSFEAPHVVILGAVGASGVIELREGMTVGYDVGWTSRGLRVTKLFPVAESEGAVRGEDPSGT